MNTFILIALALVVAVSAAPTQIQSNNVGDIVNVGIKANLDVASEIDLTQINIEGLYKNLQKLLVNLPGIGGDDDENPQEPGPEPIADFASSFAKMLQQ